MVDSYGGLSRLVVTKPMTRQAVSQKLFQALIQTKHVKLLHKKPISTRQHNTASKNNHKAASVAAHPRGGYTF